MYGVSTFIYLLKLPQNVGKYSIPIGSMYGILTIGTYITFRWILLDAIP